MDAGRFAALAAAAAQAAPMSNGILEMRPGRVLGIDGDGLAYYCAGTDDTAPGQARHTLLEKVRSARRACGAEKVVIFLTARGSPKGGRYAVARVRPYQGQRVAARRPKNWQYLREYMEQGNLPDGIEVEVSYEAEADDLFAFYASKHGDDFIIYTQDKDMQMVPGWHLDWLTHVLHEVKDQPWRQEYQGKTWGRAWFWSQMLHGDGADNVPGLPFFEDGVYKTGAKKGTKKMTLVGEKAEPVKALVNLSSDTQALIHVGALYRSYYNERWLVEMLEQGVLLWMRPDPLDPLNVVKPGHPLHGLLRYDEYPAAEAEIMQRLTEVVVEETEDDGDFADTGVSVGEAGRDVCDVPPPLLDDSSGAGSRPLDGSRSGSGAPLVQCPAGQSGEQLPPVRGGQSSGAASWARALLAASPN
jgi:hypothetical protein